MSDVYLEGCSICDQNKVAIKDAPPRERVQVTEHWRLLVHKSGLPGWMLLVPRRHIGSLADMTKEETAELGPLLQQATAAMADALGAEKSYVMLFAEAMKHAHFSLVPRMPDLPDERRGPAVAAYNSADTPLSEEERDAVADRLSAVWIS